MSAGGNNNPTHTVTRAELLGAHPSVQDLNIVTSSATNNPVKAARMDMFRQSNTHFISDASNTRGGGAGFSQQRANLCAPTGGQRIVVLRNEDNIRKGRAPPSVVAAATGGSERKLSLPPMLANANAPSGSLPPRSPASKAAPALNSGSGSNLFSGAARPGEPLAATQLKALSMPQLLRQAAKRRRPDATPSELSLVTSVESRDASTNHPCSETVYTCSCCRPRKPPSSASKVNGKAGEKVWRLASDDGDDDAGNSEVDLYENLTSVSQRGSARGKQAAAAPKAEPQITAKQIFELHQARAGGAGSLGHNMIGTSGRGPKAMGFGLTGQKVMQNGVVLDAAARAAAGQLAAARLPPGVARSEVTDLTRTTATAAAAGRRAPSSQGGASRASSSAVRRLEDALEQERRDRLQTEEQISRIRERQEKLMAQLTPDEKARMRAILDSKG